MTFVLASIATFLVLSAIVVLVGYNIGNAIKRQAQKPVKRFFGPVPRPGSYTFAINEGRVTDILENVVGWNLKLNKDNGRRLFYPDKHIPGFLEEQLGVRWIGLYPTIKEFKDFEWSEMVEKKVRDKDGNDVVRYEIETRRKTFTDSFFQFSHPVRTEAIEILGNYQVVVTMLITVLNLDPERAQFLNKDPAILLAGIIQSTVRSYICDMEFNDVKKLAGTSAGKNQELWDAIKKLNGLEMDANGKPMYETEDPLGVFGKLGKYIVRGEIVQVDAVGEAARALEAAKLAELRGNAAIKEAEKAGEARVITAKKDAEALQIRETAQANFVTATIVGPIKAGGESVGHVLEAQVLAGPDSKLNVLVQRGANAGTTIPVGKQST